MKSPTVRARRACQVTLALLGAALMAPALAQTAAQPSAAEARDALARKEGEGDQSALLKQTLTAIDKQYSMIRKGQVQASYDLNYAYIGQEKIVTDISATGLTLFEIENVSSHTVTNTVSADYGVLNNLTGNLTIPVIARYASAKGHAGISNSIGDLSLGARWQPLESRRDQATYTVTGTVRLPSGRSPFKIVAGSGQATGSGVTQFSAGLNVNRIVDPVALFGSLSLGAALPAKHLYQINGTRILTRVAPGMNVGFGMGFAYALSYGISTTLSFQQAIAAGSRLRFADGLNAKTAMQTSGMLNFGLGYRVSPKTTVNLSVGIGVTADSPNMTLGLNLPLAF